MNPVFSSLTDQGLSNITANSTQSLSGITYSFKTVVYACIITAITGGVLGWMISSKYYQSPTRKTNHSIPLKECNNDTLKRKKDTVQLTNSTKPISNLNTIEKTTPLVKHKKLSKYQDSSGVYNESKLKDEISLKNEHLVERIKKMDSIQVMTKEEKLFPITPVTEKKSLLDQLKEKEQRFNGNLFQEEKD